MRLDSEQDRKILLTLVDSAVVPVSEAHVMLDLRERLRQAEVEGLKQKTVAIVEPESYEVVH